MAADTGRGFKDLAVVDLDRAANRQASESAAKDADVHTINRTYATAAHG